MNDFVNLVSCRNLKHLAIWAVWDWIWRLSLTGGNYLYLYSTRESVHLWIRFCHIDSAMSPHHMHCHALHNRARQSLIAPIDFRKYLLHFLMQEPREALKKKLWKFGHMSKLEVGRVFLSHTFSKKKSLDINFQGR